MENVNKKASNQIKLGAIMSYISMAFNVLAGLLYTPWMIKQIGQAEYGLYALAVSIISFFAMDFGLGSAVARFLSKYIAEDDEVGAKRFLGSIYKLFIVISIVISIALVCIYVGIESIYSQLTVSEIEKLKVLFLISGFFTVISFPFKTFDGILIANERFVIAKAIELLHRVLTVALMGLALVLGYGLYALVVVNAFVGIVKLILKHVYIQRTTRTKVDFKYRGKDLYGQIFRFSAWTTVIVVAQRFVMNITPTILGAYAGSVDIAVFSIGMTIEAYTYTISGALGGLFLPKVTRMISGKLGMREVEKLLIRVGRVQLILVGLIVVGFISMGKEFIHLWMGVDFHNSYYVTVLLIIPAIVTNTQEIANTALIALNEIKYRAMASIATASISVLASIVLSQILGAVGSAIAILLGNIIGTVIILNIIYSRILEVDIIGFFKECHAKFITPLVVTLGLGLLVQHYFPVNSLGLFALKALSIGLSYFFLVWNISLNEFEKQLFLEPINRVWKETKRCFQIKHC